MKLVIAAAAVLLAGPAFAQGDVKEIDKPASTLEQILAHQAESGGQEVRVIRVTLDPHTAGAWHSHPSPVFVYVTSGALTIELEGKDPSALSAGEALAEPLNVPMRAVNTSEKPAEAVVFQISAPDKKFLEPAK